MKPFERYIIICHVLSGASVSPVTLKNTNMYCKYLGFFKSGSWSVDSLKGATGGSKSFTSLAEVICTQVTKQPVKDTENEGIKNQIMVTHTYNNQWS